MQNKDLFCEWNIKHIKYDAKNYKSKKKNNRSFQFCIKLSRYFFVSLDASSIGICAIQFRQILIFVEKLRTTTSS